MKNIVEIRLIDLKIATIQMFCEMSETLRDATLAQCFSTCAI